MKPVIWFGDSRLCVREFPEGARRVAGHELALVQAGREPSSWRSEGTGP